MNILILSNSAPGYHRFFNGLARALLADGHGVEFAVDSRYCREANQLDEIGAPVHEFAPVFAASQEDPELLRRYQRYPLNAAILSDVERAEVYNFDGDRDSGYYRRLQAALLQFFQDIIVKSSIDAIIYESVSNAFAHYAWIVGKDRGIPYVGLSASRLPGRFVIIDDPFGEHVAYAKTLREITTGQRKVPDDIREWCQNYLDNLDKIVPDYMKYSNLDNLNLANLYFKREKASKLRLMWRHRHGDHRHNFQVGNPMKLAWQMVLRRLCRRIKLPFSLKYYSQLVPGAAYLLYPLHYHPESSTSIQAAAYLDEFEVIRNIAFSMPVGVQLYVKDHTSAFANPPLSFYRRIAALPNVCLISPFENTKLLIRGSLAVITLTSTMGYEAALMNKRVFLYGSVFYEIHQNVVRVEDPSKLFELFTEFLFEPPRADRSYDEAFMAAYYLNTYGGILNFSMNEAGTEQLLDEVLPQLVPVIVSRAAAHRAAVATANG